jgi:voltage-gated potassium channel
MVFVRQAYAAIVLVTLTLAIQSAGIAALIQWARAHLPRRTGRAGRIHSTVLMVRLTSLIICLHTLEILLWASFYRWKCFSAWESAFYFSASSYSTVGSEELILQQTWRQLGPVESLTGVLMCALSASFLFAVVTRLVERDGQSEVTQER